MSPDAAISQPAPTFSILVPAFNAEETLADTLDSVLAQTEPGWEAIVVDDGSTDGTREIATRYSITDARFHVVSQPNAGLAGARDAGGAAAQGEYLCFLDADDLYLPDYLASQTRFIANYPDYDVYSCTVDALMPDGTRRPFPHDPAYDGPAETRLGDLIDHNRFTAIAAVKRATFARVGGFRSVSHLEDYDLWLRIAVAGGRFRHNPATLALYRQRPGSMTDDFEAMTRGHRDALASLLGAAALTGRDRAQAERTIRWCDGSIERSRFETRLRARDLSGARSGFWKTRFAYRNRAKFLAGLALVLVSPRSYARAVAGRSALGDRFR